MNFHMAKAHDNTLDIVRKMYKDEVTTLITHAFNYVHSKFTVLSLYSAGNTIISPHLVWYSSLKNWVVFPPDEKQFIHLA